jgi:DNA-binding response OmpR family regulator
VEKFLGKKTILIIDNERRILTHLTRKFTQLGYHVIATYEKKLALNTLKLYNPEIIVLGMEIPTLDSYAFCSSIREYFHKPIVVLSSLWTIANFILAFEAGVSEDIFKPVSLKKIEERVKQIVRTHDKFTERPQNKKDILKLQNLIIDLQTNTILKDGRKLILTPIENMLLVLLIKNANNTLSRSSIITHLWGYTPSRFVDTRVVDVYISRLRVKLENTPSKPDFITTVRGQGYTFRSFK